MIGPTDLLHPSPAPHFKKLIIYSHKIWNDDIRNMDYDNAVRPVQLESVIKRTKVHTTQSHKPKTADSFDNFERKTFRSNGTLGR